MQDIKLLICCHKKSALPQNDIYLPIHVGKASSKIELPIQDDYTVSGNVCDNISEQNSIYCEMTAMYWAWKNIRKLYPNIKYIGLCHYRRYFCSFKNSKRYVAKCARHMVRSKINSVLGKGLVIMDPSVNISSISSEDFQKYTQGLSEYIRTKDIIITSLVKCGNGTIRQFFSKKGKIHIDYLEQIIKNDYPQYYKSLNSVLNGSSLAAANMLIFKIEYLDDYCSFIFDVLKRHIEAEVNSGLINNPLTDKSYSRISGYLAELLTYTYVVKKGNSLNIGVVDKMFIENTDD